MMGQGIPTLVVQNLNCINGPQEKSGGRAFVDGVESREFWEFIKVNKLVDLGFISTQFIWFNKYHRGARMWERIDRAFMTAS